MKIQDGQELLSAVCNVVEQTSLLAEIIVGKRFPIKSLTIFSHNEGEFEKLKGILTTLGSPYNENNGPRVILYEPIRTNGNAITHLRIRKPDPERPQVGCNDFETDYESFKSQYLEKYPDNLKLIQRPEYEMIELSDPTFDVLAYVVSTKT